MNDQRLRGINPYLAQSLGPLTSILDKLILVEDCLAESSGDIQATPEERVLDLVGKTQVSLDIAQIPNIFHDSVKLLSFYHAVVLQKRRTLLKPFILPRHQHLTKPNSDISKELLGSNIEQKILDSSKMSEAAKKIRSSFQRGRGGYNHRCNRYMDVRRGGQDRRFYQQENFNNQNSYSDNKGFQHQENQSYQQNSDFGVKYSGFKPCGNRCFFRKK